MVDTVSSTIREPWGVVFNMGVKEFFNILCYNKDKADYDKKRIDEYKKRH